MTVSSYTFDNGEWVLLSIGVLLIAAAIPFGISWVRRPKDRYDFIRIGAVSGTISCLVVGLMFAPLAVVAANNHFKTDQAAFELRQQGFTVVHLDLSDGHALVYGRGGCLVPVKVFTIPSETGEWHTRVFALGAFVRKPQEIPCIGRAQVPNSQ